MASSTKKPEPRNPAQKIVCATPVVMQIPEAWFDKVIASFAINPFFQKRLLHFHVKLVLGGALG